MRQTTRENPVMKLDSSTSNLFDFFHHHIELAQTDARIALDPDTTLYLVSLLVDRARTDRTAPQEDTLAELHARGAGASFVAQARVYRELGDRALYLMGWFKESLSRRIVSPSYYASMGAAAYHRTDLVFKAAFADAFGPVFRELADRFRDCAEVLAQVRREHEAAPSVLDRLYQQWLETGSDDTAARLRARGLLVPARTGSGPIG